MLLSVVVTIVDGGEALRRCLRGLAAQDGAPPLEILVPYDDTVPGIAEIAAEFPAVRFLPLGRIETARPPEGAAGQHELFDRRRSHGLAAATGELVAILEDRGVPRPDWARTIVERHRLPHAVVGGAIENGRDRPLNWAVYFCDFGRYERPFEPGPVQYVSDVNICYKRSALEATRALWRDRYHETTVHWALLRAGETLWLDPGPVVDQHRDGLTLGGLLAERVAWGRLFAYTRAREATRAQRLVLTLASPILPVLLFFRHARMQARKRVTFSQFVKASPIVALLLAAWCLGELRGYITARP